jgi:hypothetical protein
VSDRLEELQHQRALVQQHLAWLEGEIARESGHPTPASAQAPQALGSSGEALPTPSSSVSAPLSTSAADAEVILENFRAESGRQPQQVKLGCWIAFAASFVLLGLVLLVWWLLRGR